MLNRQAMRRVWVTLGVESGPVKIGSLFGFRQAIQTPEISPIGDSYPEVLEDAPMRLAQREHQRFGSSAEGFETSGFTTRAPPEVSTSTDRLRFAGSMGVLGLPNSPF